jgi:asparagine synthase (glutamine-hydrolysing)
MSGALAHRGPDDSDIWADPEAGVGLGHRRLSIVDLSTQGRQPMESASGRYVLVYNGEIYNHRLLRKELESVHAAPEWRGHSDTEVMLAAIECWGMDKTLARLNGMFSFALWDRREKLLHLARDRFGEKPLYYGWVGDTFLSGSELKALKLHPLWQEEIDRGALALFMRHNYIPAPYSIYPGFKKLLPGHVLSIRFPQDTHDMISPKPYWLARNAAESGVENPITKEARDIVESLDSLLRDAVSLRMEADVPLGAFLSGGYDSSTVVALMQAQSSRPIRTFSIGFYESEYNEAKHAKVVAKHLGTDHTELYVTPEEAMAVIPRLPYIYDEPFSDSSQIPAFLVSKMTRETLSMGAQNLAANRLVAESGQTGGGAGAQIGGAAQMG